jgi:hypothetical protein
MSEISQLLTCESQIFERGVFLEEYIVVLSMSEVGINILSLMPSRQFRRSKLRYAQLILFSSIVVVKH